MLGNMVIRGFMIAVMLCHNPVFSQTISDITRLIKDKGVDYDKSVRPVSNQSLPITIYLSFDLLAIPEVDEVQQTIVLNGYFGMSWLDERMVWNPQDYGSTYMFTVESDRFWTPTIMLTNSNDEFKKIGEPWLFVRYAPNGQAYYFPGTIMKVSCKLDIRFYPWDQHVCFLSINAWGHTNAEYALQNTTSEVGTSGYARNGAWNVIGSYIRTKSYESVVTYVVLIHIERQPTYVLVNVILPVIILSLLNLMIYFIPTDSGERLSFSITLLLAIAVFLTIVGDNLPKTSTPMAIFSFYLLTILVISNCVTLSVIFSLCLYHRDESKPVVGCWKRITRVMKCQCTSRKHILYKHRNNGDIDNSEMTLDVRSIPQFSDNRMNSRHVHHIRSPSNPQNQPVWPPNNAAISDSYKAGEHDKPKEVQGDSTDTDITWKEVSVAFDRLCFIFFLLLFLVANVVTFVEIYTGRQEVDLAEVFDNYEF